MNDPTIITDRLDELQQEWEEQSLEPSLRKMPEGQAEFTTVSLQAIHRLFTPLAVPAPPLQPLGAERDGASRHRLAV